MGDSDSDCDSDIDLDETIEMIQGKTYFTFIILNLVLRR